VRRGGVCPVNTGRGTRRVQSVRGEGRGGWGGGALTLSVATAPRSARGTSGTTPRSSAARSVTILERSEKSLFRGRDASVRGARSVPCTAAHLLLSSRRRARSEISVDRSNATSAPLRPARREPGRSTRRQGTPARLREPTQCVRHSHLSLAVECRADASAALSLKRRPLSSMTRALSSSESALLRIGAGAESAPGPAQPRCCPGGGWAGALEIAGDAKQFYSWLLLGGVGQRSPNRAPACGCHGPLALVKDAVEPLHRLLQRSCTGGVVERAHCGVHVCAAARRWWVPAARGSTFQEARRAVGARRW
jgi:hypothetical protein